LFIGLAVIPSINANDSRIPVKSKFVETNIRIHRDRGITPFTLRLTESESKEIDVIFDNLKVRLDSAESDKEIDEIYDNDNTSEYNFIVVSSAVRSLLFYADENKVDDIMLLLNPSANANNDIIEVEFDKDPDFLNPHRFTYTQDTLYTKIEVDTTFGQRTWIRYKLTSSQEFGTVHSFILDTLMGYSINDSISFVNMVSDRIDYNGNEWQLGIL